jgi:hypothetical protein
VLCLRCFVLIALQQPKEPAKHPETCTATADIAAALPAETSPALAKPAIGLLWFFAEPTLQ